MTQFLRVLSWQPVFCPPLNFSFAEHIYSMTQYNMADGVSTGLGSRVSSYKVISAPRILENAKAKADS